MIGKILNYGIRIIIIIIGILLLSGFFKPESAMMDGSVFRVMGVIFILYGIYRMISYHNALKKYKNLKNYDE